MESVNYIDNQTYAIYDGGDAQMNCTDINKVEFSYNNGLYVLGAAHMYNQVRINRSIIIQWDQTANQTS